jgi:hypothetical protein
MNKIKKIILALAVILSGAVFINAPVHAACDPKTDVQCVPICDELDEQQKQAAGCTVDKNTSVASNLTHIIDAAISIVGILAVLVIVIAGQRYITAGGDSAKVKQAKDMILYAVVGIVVAGLAWAIINFVAANLGK